MILVTGGAGYIGSHTLISLHEAGYDFGYKPNTKLSDGIGKFVEWYGEFYK